MTVRLADRFGDDGMVGGCVIEAGQSGWSIALLMMSCRAMGRGVIDALLAWICQAAGRAGAQAVRVPCLVTPRGVPLRIALASAGFRAGAGTVTGPADAAEADAAEAEAADGREVKAGRRTAVFGRQLAGPLPALPGWATAPEYP
jgi:predicted enzyme involved in methoxymalonyl-ACP biosynthesis